MISSIRLDGTTACMTIEGATNAEVFRAYVGNVLLPSLQPGDVVVMDNLGAHKNPQTSLWHRGGTGWAPGSALES